MAAEQETGKTVVVGLGQTGRSCARFLVKKGVQVVAVDTRSQPPGIEEFKKELPELQIYCGELDEALLTSANEIVISPGVSLQESAIQAAIAQGVSVIGDITLFRRYVNKSIVAITGSNAKSTVTSLVGKILRDAGMNAVVAGNIGIPVMELLNQGMDAECYVLELSSFQLETTENLNAKVATVLNVSEDHMDRYQGMDEYVAAKQRIYQGCETAVINRDDPSSEPQVLVKNQLYFQSSSPRDNEFGLIKKGEEVWLARDHSPIVRASDLKIKGRHNQMNALAAVAIASAVGVPMESIVCTLTEFSGLPHRCQWVANVDGIDWFNDSKGTNVGATVAAIEGIGSDIKGKVVLIAGGEGKDADFAVLKRPVRKYVKQVVLIGRDAAMIADALGESASVLYANDLSEAVSIAAKEASRGDAVLLSPACASFDMFTGFEDRGDQFINSVQRLEAYS